MINITKKVLLQALDSVPAPSAILDAARPGYPIIYVNAAFAKLLGRESGELTGLPFSEVIAEGRLPEIPDSPGAESEARECFADRQKWHTSGGTSVPLEVRMTRLHDRPGKPGFLLVSVIDNAQSAEAPQSGDTTELRDELVDARRQIRNLQRKDPVTGLANRGAFDEVLQRDWAIVRREQRRIGVIVFAVDCLDEYRQIYGRHATDSLLRKIGHAIGGTLRRGGDFAARISTDRFAVLVGDATEEQAGTCAQRIASKVRNLAVHHPRSTVSRFATVSWGVASEVPPWKKQSMTLLDEAERRIQTRVPAMETRQSDALDQTANEEAVT